MGHFTYPNVATVKEEQSAKDVCWRGRYIAAPVDTPPGEGYTVVRLNIPNPQQVLLAIERLVPESSTPTDKVVYEIRDSYPERKVRGESRVFAYVMAEISRWRKGKLDEFPYDVWYTGLIGIKDDKPFLDDVDHTGFDLKLQNFLSDRNQDRLFFVPFTNICNHHEPWFREHNADVLSVKQLKGIPIETLATRKTIVKVRGDELPDLVELLFHRPQARRPEIGPNPYRGLRFFREADADLFFGRNAAIDELVTAVLSRPFLAVIGASGSGKSSLVYAGLIPCLRQHGQWLIVALRPAHDPFYALADALIALLNAGTNTDEVDQMLQAKKLANSFYSGDFKVPDLLKKVYDHNPHTHILLFIDQFEELYTTCSEPEDQRRFLDLLLHATEAHTSVCKVLLTMRADFMGKALAYPGFAGLVKQHHLIVGPMRREELRQAIEQPAALQDVRPEDGLTERILEAVGDEAGGLPLVQFTLTELWERQIPPAFGKPGRLTHAAYEEIGGVEQALAQYAERVYATLTPDEQQRMPQIFTQLIHPGAGTEDTRRVAARSDIGEEHWPLVVRLADARLVVTSTAHVPVCEVTSTAHVPVCEATNTAHVPVCEKFASETHAVHPGANDIVDVAHEALIRGWLRLREWIDADREFRMWQERLRSAMRQWQASNRDDGALLRGAPLAEAEQWLQERRLAPEEQRFIHTGLDLCYREEQDRKAQQQRELELARKAVREEQQRVAVQTRAKKRLRAWLAIATLLAIVAIGAAFGAYSGFRQADTQKGEFVIRTLVLSAYKEDSENHRETAALLLWQAERLNKRYKGTGAGQIREAFRWVFRTQTITEGYGYAPKDDEFFDLVCQSVNFNKALTQAEWAAYVGEDIAEDIARDAALQPDCSESEPPNDWPLQLRDEWMATSDLQALSLNLRKGIYESGYPIQYVGDVLKNLDDRFEEQEEGLVILDNATGLMWQQSGSPEPLTEEKAREYITKELNEKQFSGFADWRLPTVEELLSLVEEAAGKTYRLTEQDFNDLQLREHVVTMLTPLQNKQFDDEKDFVAAIRLHTGPEQADDFTERILDKARSYLHINPIFDNTQRWCWSVDKRRIKDEH